MYLLCTPWQRGFPGRPSDSACVSSPDCFHATCVCTPRARRWSQAAQTDRCHTVLLSPWSWTWTAPQKPRTSARRSRTICSDQSAAVHINQHITVTYTHLTALFPGIPGRAGTRKVKPIWILLIQEAVSSSGISWAMCKSTPCSRQITTPAPHHSVFYRPDALPATQPTASKHWRHKHVTVSRSKTNSQEWQKCVNDNLNELMFSRWL